MRAFRKRFIIMNMSLVGVVLLTAFVVIGTIICTNVYGELKNTMSNVLNPWNINNAGSPGGLQENETLPDKKGNMPDKSDNKNDDLPARPDEKKETKNNENKKSDSEKRHERNDHISTIFYYKSEKRVRVISDSEVFDANPEDIVSAILAQDDDFGTINRYHIIYYRETAGSIVKIAVCDESYIGSRLFKTVMILSLAFILSMLVLFLISIRLARFAEKPLRQSIEMERKFVADISHDLKTPITVTMANNSILKANKNSSISDNMQWIESTDKASEDMMQLIGNMLTLSAVDTQTKKISTVPVSLTSAAERCILQFESVAYEKNVTLEESIEDDLTVLATEEYLKRICSSLVENAFKYEPNGGKVTVKAYSRKHRIFFTVQNQNSRISHEDLPHIFDRFYRGDKARTESKGHGLGLPIIHQMAKLCGANIEAVSNEHDGTIFTVTFRKA